MKRKISTAVVGLSVFSFGLFGVNIGDGGVVKAAHGDTPAPKQESHADFPAPKLNSHGDSWAPAYDHGRPPISSYNKGDTWAPKSVSIGDHGGAPAYNKGDGGVSPAYTNTHGEGMAPKQESHADFFLLR